MKPSLAASLIATTVAAALVVGTGGAALAAESTAGSTAPRSLSAVQALGAAATAARIGALDTSIPKITSNAYLNATEQAQVLGTLTGDRSAMVSLAAKIAADNDLAVATAGYRSIFTGYRVFAVAIPQAHYAAAASGLSDSAIPALQAAQVALQAAIAGPLASKDTPAIDATMAHLANQISVARSAVSGVSAFALSVTPEQFNANHEILASARAAVKATTAAVKAARADVASVTAALR
ncbi:MAG: hypothetical protein V4531_01200 [Actinomycetota bacterium]